MTRVVATVVTKLHHACDRGRIYQGTVTRLERYGRWIERIVVAGAVVASLMPRCVAAADLIVDDFSSSVRAVLPVGISQTMVGKQTVTDGPGLSGVVGGVRGVSLALSAVDYATFDSVTVGIVPRQTRLSFASSTGADGSVVLLYDRGGRGLNVDLSLAQGVRINITAADMAAVPYPVTVTLADGATSASAVQTVTGPGSQRLDFAFTTLRGVDLHHVRSITVSIDPRTAGDVQLADIRIVGAR